MEERIIWQNDRLRAVFDKQRGAWVSVRGMGDIDETEFLLTPEEFPEYDGRNGRFLGQLELELSRCGEERLIYTANVREGRKITYGENLICVEYQGVQSREMGWLNLTEQYRMGKEGLCWEILFENPSDEPIRIRQLGIPLLMNQCFRGDDAYKYQKCVLRHSCLIHHSSYVYWSKSSGDGPILAMLAQDDTFLDSFERAEKDPVFGSGQKKGAFEGLYTVYPYHREFPDGAFRASDCILLPGESKRLCFLFQMMPNFGALQDWLAENGGLAVEASPGMVTEKGRELTLYVRSRERIDRIEADGGEILKQECMAERMQNPSGKEEEIFSHKISLVPKHCGRWELTLSRGNMDSALPFFAIEAPGEIIRSQAAFIAEKQFETDVEDPCYHGLLMWDMTVKGRINASCNPTGPNWFAGGSDEIGLASGLFLSEKNVCLPREQEIRVLDAYCRDFIEGRLTEQPGNKVHRMVPWFEMFDPWKGKGDDDAWRAFNYVHVVNTYLNMYRIARTGRWDFLEQKQEYLKKAYRYMKAMFTFWMFPEGVGGMQYGNMGESAAALYLDGFLREEGLEDEAREIGALLDRKAAFFASKAFPFGSEMAYDSTAFEAVYGYGKRIGDTRVMESSVKAVLANRGRQPVWLLHMTDLRQMGDSSWNVSYMTQLGAWAIYDWVFNGKHYEPELIKAWYASYLAGFALYNSEGCWDMSPENRGASAWIVNGWHGKGSGQMENGECYWKGCVPMSGESALGYYGALRIAACALFEEDGEWKVLGGSLEQLGNGCRIVPQDGLGLRFYDTIHDYAYVSEGERIREAVWDGEKWRIEGFPLVDGIV